MEAAANRLLFESIVRTLHSHSFSRSSTQSCNMLSDLLGRYLKLLALTCAGHAHHSGRTDINALDAVAAMEELGLNLSELKQFQEVEGKDISRYAYISSRRQMDLREMRGILNNGVYHDASDSQHILFERVQPPSQDDIESEPEFEPSETDEESHHLNNIDPQLKTSLSNSINPTTHATLSAPRSPPLPLSPISNPSSPGPRKRMRTNYWEPPDYVPDFLPPFPLDSFASAINLTHDNQTDSGSAKLSTTPQPERLPSPSPPPTAPTAKASYLSSVPYESSTISSKPTSHLPKAPEKLPPKAPPTTSTHLALLTAQHYFLTNRPPPPNTQLPSRHALALALLDSSRKRYLPPDTLYGSSEPNKMRVTAPSPSFPVPSNPEDQKKGVVLPIATRSVITGEGLATHTSMQTSRIPTLARSVLQPGMHRRATRLAPPPPLQRDSKKLTYGPGVPAPWNSAPVTANNTVPNGKKGTENKKEVKEGDGTRLADATLFATWEYDVKDFKAPLMSKRARMPSTLRIKGEHAYP